MATQTAYEMSAAQYRGEGTEAEWRATVKDAAATFGWEVLIEIPDKAYAELAKIGLHKVGGKWRKKPVSPGMREVYSALRGQPDLLLGHPEHGPIAVELKIPGESPRPHQTERLLLYQACRVPSFVWETGSKEMVLVLQYGPGAGEEYRA